MGACLGSQHHVPPEAAQEREEGGGLALCEPTKLPIGRFYDFGPKLGEGLTAIVREATRKGTSERYAVKIMRKASLKAEDVLAVREEVTILKSLEHPNIIRVYDFLEEPRSYFVVMELVQGGELFDRIARKSKYTEKEARDLFRILGRAVSHLHDHDIVHRDLKLENLLLRDANDDVTVAIADFGFAAKLTPTRPELTELCGTPNYMAPEIIVAQPYGKAVDVWALGVLTYILLGGYAPFSHQSRMKLFGLIRKGRYEFHPEYWGHVSDEAKDLINGLLTLDPSKRLTVQQALAHPWVTQKDYILRQRDLESTKVELRRFNARRKFKASYQAVVAANKLGVVLERLRLLADSSRRGVGSDSDWSGWSSLGASMEDAPTTSKQVQVDPTSCKGASSSSSKMMMQRLQAVVETRMPAAVQ